MFHSSTQKNHWLFDFHQDVGRLRAEANASYLQKHAEAATRKGCQFVTPVEEAMVCQHYLKKLFEFCGSFKPPVPRNVLGTAAAYFKRFYLHTSIMEHHPKDIFFCCVYLAFKIEEYNVSIDQFIHILVPELHNRVAELVLSHELLILKKLKFHLTIHSPFRPLEGFIIDLKTREPKVTNPDALRKGADSFLLKSLYSDVSLLHPPSQIALASLQYSAKESGVNISSYMKSVLLGVESSEVSSKLFQNLQRIQDIVLAASVPESSREIAYIEKKLELCRVQVLNPASRKRKSEEHCGDASSKKTRPLELEAYPGIEEDPIIPGLMKL